MIAEINWYAEEVINKSNKMVGMAGFEPTTTSPPARCATRLRYIPKSNTNFFTHPHVKIRIIKII